MWDIKHIERGSQVLTHYQLEDFHRDFRDFYDALRDPTQFATDPPEQLQLDGVRAYNAFTITPDDTIDTIADVAISSETTDGTIRNVVPFRDPSPDLVVCILPAVEFDPSFDYHDEFHQIVLGHLAAQVRDCYLHMGEEPPDEYKVEGIGKLDIHGDGVGAT
jgi:hypothetical protein